MSVDLQKDEMKQTNTKKTGNYTCESCEQDRKKSKINAVLLKDEPCFEEYKKIEECMTANNYQISLCSDLWKNYAFCRRNSDKQLIT